MKQLQTTLKIVVFLLGTFLAGATTVFGQEVGEFDFSKAGWVPVGGDAPVETSIYNSIIVLDENPYNIRTIYSGNFDLLGRAFTTEWEFLPFVLNERVSSAGVLNGKIIYPSSLGLIEYQGGIIPGTDVMFQSSYSEKEIEIDVIRKCIWVADETFGEQHLYQYFYETGQIVEISLPATWGPTGSMFLDKQSNELFLWNGAGFYKYDGATGLSEISELAGAIGLGLEPLSDGRYIVSYFVPEGAEHKYWNPSTGEVGGVLEQVFRVFASDSFKQYVYWFDQYSEPDQLRIGIVQNGSEILTEIDILGEPIRGAAHLFVGFDKNIYAIATDCGLDNSPLGITSFYGYSAARLDQLTAIVNNEFDVQVYPNPAHETLSVIIENLAGVSVYSLTGQRFEVPSTVGGTTTIDVSDLPAGMYLLRGETNDGTIGMVTFEKL